MPQVERKARNQALFREVNERMLELARAFEVADQRRGFVCECSQIGCNATIELRPEVYAFARDDPTAFIVIPGHEDGDHEEVLVRESSYLIVRNKAGTAAEIAGGTA